MDERPLAEERFVGIPKRVEVLAKVMGSELFEPGVMIEGGVWEGSLPRVGNGDWTGEQCWAGDLGRQMEAQHELMYGFLMGRLRTGEFSEEREDEYQDLVGEEGLGLGDVIIYDLGKGVFVTSARSGGRLVSQRSYAIEGVIAQVGGIEIGGVELLVHSDSERLGVVAESEYFYPEKGGSVEWRRTREAEAVFYYGEDEVEMDEQVREKRDAVYMMSDGGETDVGIRRVKDLDEVVVFEYFNGIGERKLVRTERLDAGGMVYSWMWFGKEDKVKVVREVRDGTGKPMKQTQGVLVGVNSGASTEEVLGFIDQLVEPGPELELLVEASVRLGRRQYEVSYQGVSLGGAVEEVGEAGRVLVAEKGGVGRLRIACGEGWLVTTDYSLEAYEQAS